MNVTSRLAASLAIASLLFVPSLVHAQHSRAGMIVGVRLLSPSSGAIIHGNAVQIHVGFTHWRLNCAWAGKANKPHMGHYHILLDGSLVNMFCANTASVSMQNVVPGKHTLTVVPAENNHNDMMFMQSKEMRQVSFTYRPTNPLAVEHPVILGKPSIKITSPSNGQTVSGTFQLKVAVHNFRFSCNLYGKTNLSGWGHWHINHDSMNGPMMGMGTMLGMSCAHSYLVNTVGLKPGKHTFFAILEDNQHAPLMPSIFAAVTVRVK